MGNERERDPCDPLLAEYADAMAQERTEWKAVQDTNLGSAERVVAYARWLAAADRVKALAEKLRDAGSATPPPP